MPDRQKQDLIYINPDGWVGRQAVRVEQRGCRERSRVTTLEPLRQIFR